MNSTIGRINKLETFGLVDGPGVRYVMFLQGCDMRCQYCHNPETWTPEGGDKVNVMHWTPEEAFQKAMRYKPYWRDNGGITVSGGEPLLQIDFVTEFFTLAKEKNVHTTVDTSGNPFQETPEFLEKFDRLMQVTDLFMLDLKEMDEQKHRKLTGQTNKNILAMGDYIAAHGGEMWVRHVLVPGLTDDEEGLRAIRTKLDQWGSAVSRVEILPYHTLGLAKWQNLGIKYPLDGVRVPTQEEVESAERILGIRD